MDKTFYYFGPIREHGHYFWLSENAKDYYGDKVQPWGYNVDGGLAPKKGFHAEFPEGSTIVHHKDGWTAISFWDRTVDSRPGSCSTYLAKGIFSFEEMVTMSKEKFPNRWNAMKFTITEIK